MLLKSTLFLVGISISRLTLILFGIVVLRSQGPGAYGGYVTLLTLANLLSALAVMGVIPLILSSSQTSKHDKGDLIPLARAGVLNLVIVCCFFQFAIEVSELVGIGKGVQPLPTSIYFLGYSLIAISAAMFNQKKMHITASISWAAPALLALGAGATAVSFSTSFSTYMNAFALCWLLAGITFFLFALNEGFSFFIIKKQDLSSIFGSIFRTYYGGIFGIPILAMFFYLNFATSSLNNNNLLGTFSFSFQLFGLTILIPGTLAGILVPNIIREKNINSVKLIRVRVLYIGIGLFCALMVYAFLPTLFSLAKLPLSDQSGNVVLLMQLAGLLATISALDIQFLVAKRRFLTLIIGSAIWTLAIFCYLWFNPMSDLNCARSVLLAYLLLSTFLYSMNCRKSNSVPIANKF